MSAAAETGLARRTGCAEHDVLILCARTHLDGDAREELRARLGAPLDWGVLLDHSYRHGNVPLLYHNLCLVTDSGMPPDVREELRRRSVAATAHSMLLVAELATILPALEGAGCPAVAWKGPVLAHSVYPSPELRTFIDLDLIVPRRGAGAAVSTLLAMGYRAKGGSAGAIPEVLRKPDHSLTLVHRGRRAVVDLHWGAAARYFSPAMETDSLCQEADTVRAGALAIRALRPDPMLLALSVHGAKHGPFPWPKLKWITDVEAYLRRYSADDWDRVLGLARERGCERMVLLGVALARDLLGAPSSAPLDEAIGRHAVVRHLLPGIRGRILAEDPSPFAFADRLRFDLSVRERMRDRARYQSQRLLMPSPRDVAAEKMPAGLRFLRVPLRLFRLARKYVARPSRIRELF